MRLEQLQYLTEIARSHSFRVAAENLYVTQPALSESIKKLEKELGVVLLERTPNGVYPTAFGLEIVEISQRILSDAHLIEQKARAYYFPAASLTGVLRIFSRPAINERFMAQMITVLRTKQPDLQLTVFERNARAILKAVETGQCDLGLAVLKEQTLLEMERAGTFRAARIMPIQLYLVVRANSALAQKKSVSLREISTLRLALHSADDADFAMIDDTIFGDLQKPKVIFRSDDMHLINQRLLEENIGTIYNGLRLKALPAGLTAIAIKEVDDLYMWYVFQKGVERLDKIRYVMDLLDAEVFKRSENY